MHGMERIRPTDLRRVDSSFVCTSGAALANVLPDAAHVTEACYVASGTETNTPELVAELLIRRGADLEVEVCPGRGVFDVRGRQADRIAAARTTAAARDLGFETRIDLASGMLGRVESGRSGRASSVVPSP